MSNEPIKVEKRKTGFTIFSLVGVCILGGVFFAIAGKEFNIRDVSPFDVVLAIVTILLIILLSWSFFNEPKAYILYSDRLELQYLARKPRTLIFADIINWEERSSTGRYGDHYSLVLYSQSDKFTITSNFTESYDLIKAYATKDKHKKAD